MSTLTVVTTETPAPTVAKAPAKAATKKAAGKAPAKGTGKAPTKPAVKKAPSKAAVVKAFEVGDKPEHECRTCHAVKAVTSFPTIGKPGMRGNQCRACAAK